MMTLIKGLSVATALALLPVMAYGQSIPPELAQDLAKKYSPRISVLKETTRPNSFSTVLKKTNLGPYVQRSRITTLGGAARLGKSGKRIEKYCQETQSGTFNQVRKLDALVDSPTSTIEITDNGKQYSLTANELFYLTRTHVSPNGVTDRSDGWTKDHYRRFIKLSEKNRLGVFECNAQNGETLWSIALIPDRFLTIESQVSANSANYKKNVSILPLDAETIENFRTASASVENVNQIFANEERQAASDREARISTLRATADVGTETSCGMVIQKRGALVEVDLKSKYSQNSGKDTAWLKTNDLLPDETKEQCLLN